MSFFERFFDKSENFFLSIAQIERGFQKLGRWVTKTVCLKTFNSQGDRDVRILGFCDCKKFQVLKSLKLVRFENGFDFRKLHHFASKKVLETIFPILMVIETQHFR